MALETATHINDLVITNPDGLDDLSQGDNHIRMLKDVIKRDLPLTTPATALGISLLTSPSAFAANSSLGVVPAGGRNKIINGGFTIDQRYDGVGGTIPTGGTVTYRTDRFYAYATGASLTGGAQNLFDQTPNFSVAGAALNTGWGVGTRLPRLVSRSMTGIHTLSVKISSNVARIITWSIYRAATEDAFGNITTPTRTLVSTGSWNYTGGGGVVQFSASVDLTYGSNTGFEIVFTGGALLATENVALLQVQLESGNIAAENIVFDWGDPTAELARCKYFYNRFTANGGLSVLGSGHQNSTTVSRITLPISDMRENPTVAFGGSVLLDIAGATTAATLSTQYNSINTVAFDVTHAAVGAAGGAVMLQLPNSAANYIELDSELYT
jgi:hypothetical protein